LDYSIQQYWTNKFSANISVSIPAAAVQVYDARTLHEGDVIEVNNYFGSGHTVVQQNSDSIFALKGTGLGTTAAHTWEFLDAQSGAATRLVHHETWTGGLSFLFMRFGPVRPLLEDMFKRFNLELKRSAERAG